MSPWSFPVLAAALVCTTGSARAQLLYPVTVRGQLVDRDKRLVLYPASVRNLSAQTGVYSDRGGYYKISARQHDTITISFVGYAPDTIFVKQAYGMEEHNLELRALDNTLKGVKVVAQYNAYQLDSLARMQEFERVLSMPNQGLIDTKGRPQFGFGLVFTPFTRFSRAEKQKRKFKRIFKKYDEEQYIAYRYPNRLVSSVTGLTGDSLLNFMYLHTPTYEELRGMSNLDLVVWITGQYRTWLKKD